MKSTRPLRKPGGNLVARYALAQLPTRLGKGILAIGILLATGMAIEPVENKVWNHMEEKQEGFHLANLEEAAGQGLVLGVLGGFRALMADILWLKTMLAWETESLEKTISLIQFTISVDPSPTFFWINGARIMANDMPYWPDSQGKTPEATRKNREALAKAAIRLLQKGHAYHPEKPDMIIEIGNVNYNQLRDMEAAAEYYHRAYTKYATTPYYVGRLHAQLLRKLGRNQEAYKFLTGIYPELPDEIIYAQKKVVLKRIRQLEKSLNISPEKRFRPEGGTP
tara:strand:+ start:476 stop:1318 length:843 start_codon:yes stop_codon:yes gene_type:complete